MIAAIKWKSKINFFGLSIAVLFWLGCGGNEFHEIHGTVTCGGNPVDAGHMRFVPIEDTRGPTGVVEIGEGGQFRLKSHGGLPTGKFRIEVDARKKTGRKSTIPLSGEMVDETVRICPDRYAGPSSPLTIEVPGESDGRIDIDVPAK